MTKLLILYVFHIYNDRVEQFIKNCIFDDENVDFIIISNNKNYKIYVDKNVKILIRDNIGLDFGGWSDALLTDNLYEKYDNFIFVNSSVIGPFLPSDFTGKWTDIYINGLQNNNIKLFGSTINAMGDPLNTAHVQSYIFSMDKTTLKYLIDCGIFSMTNYVKTMHEAVWEREVLMSRKIIENNWNIGSLMKYYQNVDFTFNNKKPEEYNIKFLGDITNSDLRKNVWTEYDFVLCELVFIKGDKH